MAPDKNDRCAGCGHIRDLHHRYVRNLNCCYDCHCTRFQGPDAGMLAAVEETVKVQP